jgi:hypothetical protein
MASILAGYNHYYLPCTTMLRLNSTGVTTYLKEPHKVHQAEKPDYRTGAICNEHTLLSVRSGIENGIQKRSKEIADRQTLQSAALGSIQGVDRELARLGRDTKR